MTQPPHVIYLPPGVVPAARPLAAGVSVSPSAVPFDRQFFESCCRRPCRRSANRSNAKSPVWSCIRSMAQCLSSTASLASPIPGSPSMALAKTTTTPSRSSCPTRRSSASKSTPNRTKRTATSAYPAAPRIVTPAVQPRQVEVAGTRRQAPAQTAHEGNSEEVVVPSRPRACAKASLPAQVSPFASNSRTGWCGPAHTKTTHDGGAMQRTSRRPRMTSPLSLTADTRTTPSDDADVLAAVAAMSAPSTASTPATCPRSTAICGRALPRRKTRPTSRRSCSSTPFASSSAIARRAPASRRGSLA